MKTTITISDNTYTVNKGQCYSYGVDREGVIFELSEITHDTYKESTKDMTRHYGNGVSDNVVLFYDDNGGVLFVKSSKEQMQAVIDAQAYEIVKLKELIAEISDITI